MEKKRTEKECVGLAAFSAACDDDAMAAKMLELANLAAQHEYARDFIEERMVARTAWVKPELIERPRDEVVFV